MKKQGKILPLLKKSARTSLIGSSASWYVSMHPINDDNASNKSSISSEVAFGATITCLARSNICSLTNSAKLCPK